MFIICVVCVGGPLLPNYCHHSSEFIELMETAEPEFLFEIVSRAHNWISSHRSCSYNTRNSHTQSQCFCICVERGRAGRVLPIVTASYSNAIMKNVFPHVTKRHFFKLLLRWCFLYSSLKMKAWGRFRKG